MAKVRFPVFSGSPPPSPREGRERTKNKYGSLGTFLARAEPPPAAAPKGGGGTGVPQAIRAVRTQAKGCGANLVSL